MKATTEKQNMAFAEERIKGLINRYLAKKCKSRILLSGKLEMAKFATHLPIKP